MCQMAMSKVKPTFRRVWYIGDPQLHGSFLTIFVAAAYRLDVLTNVREEAEVGM